MKHLSLKFILTFWFALPMATIAALSMVFILNVSRVAVETDMKGVLIERVRDNRNEIEVEDGVAVLEGDFWFYRNGVTCAAFRADGTIIDGELPDFAMQAPFKDRTIQSVGDYYVYDYFVSRGGGVWIRGVSQQVATISIASTVSRLAAILLPSSVALAALLGFLISWLNLRPLQRLQREIEEIAADQDLSRRVKTRGGSAEVTRLARSFNQMVARLEQSFQAEKQFTSNASHELRTPTTVILAECEYALQEPHPAEDYRESLEVVQRQAKRMSSMIARLLSFTRLEQGTEKLHLERLDLGELAETVGQEYTAGRATNVEVAVQVQDGIFVRADLTLLTRLMENLIDNACKFGSRHVVIRAAAEGAEAVFSVEDDGDGIPEDQQEKIWDRFYQADRSRSGNRKGSCGIGLSLVRQIAALHGGTVSLRSTPGEGSAFTFRMPRA